MIETVAAAVLLDMDGTLVDSTAVVERLWIEWSASHGVDPAQTLAIVHGRQGKDSMALLLPDRPHEVNIAENEQLLSMLAAKGIDAGAVLDAVPVAPIAVSIDPMERMRRDADVFRRAADLPQFSVPQSNADPAENVPLYGRLLGQFLRR